jgi:Domain of unknown function (DUF5615)
VKVLLDENFPLRLHRHLTGLGIECAHIITLGQRGLPDEQIRARLMREELMFLTQDADFWARPAVGIGIVVLSRVPQSLLIAERIQRWTSAIRELQALVVRGKLYEIEADGRLVPWDERAH